MSHPELPPLTIAKDAPGPSVVHAPDLEGGVIGGDRDTALAFATAARRARLRDELVGAGWSLSDRRLRLARGEALSGSALEASVRHGVTLAPALAFDPSTIEATLAANATADPEPAIREQNLEALMLRLGHEAPPVVDLARRLSGDGDDAVALLSAAILDDRPALTSRGVARTSALDTRAALRLTAVLSRTALEGREAALFTLSEHLEEDVQRYAIEVLGQVGGLSAVMPLLERAQGARKRPAKAAVAAIQAREGGAPGALALVERDGAAGGLTLTPPAQREGGEV